METTPETILVVEDAESVRKLVCAMLEQSGYRCLEAADGPDALRILKDDNEPVDLVLTDMVMPKMSGAELARHIAILRPHTRIVFMSGYSDETLIHVADEKSSLFLLKPFTTVALTEMVRRALDDKRPEHPETPHPTR